MDIGKEKPGRTFEPAEDPFKTPKEVPAPAPVEVPEKGKVGA